MVLYDAHVLQEQADALYSRAESIIFVWTLLGMMIGAASFGLVTMTVEEDAWMIGAGLGLVIGGVIANKMAHSRVLWIKAQAQLILCMVKIETNGRTSPNA